MSWPLVPLIVRDRNVPGGAYMRRPASAREPEAS